MKIKFYNIDNSIKRANQIALISFSIAQSSSNPNIKQSHRSHMNIHIQDIQQTK